MKVVLLKDVKNLGKAGTIQNVSDGHALNMLIPRGQAVLATAAATKRAEAVQANEVHHREVSVALIVERLNALAEERTVIRKKANDKGHLYDAVDAKDVAEATQLPVDAIRLEKPFKEVGTFDVPVAYGKDFGKVSIVVEAE